MKSLLSTALPFLQSPFSAKNKYLLAIVLGIVFDCGHDVTAQGQSKPKEKDFRDFLENIYKKTFDKAEVTIEADKEMQDLIDKAEVAYKEKQGNAKKIEENFKLFCNTVLSYAVQCKVQQLMPAVVVTTESIQKARFKLCPLWPFC